MTEVEPELFARILQRAQADAAFRRHALLQPETVLREAGGMTFPDGARLEVLEHRPQRGETGPETTAAELALQQVVAHTAHLLFSRPHPAPPAWSRYTLQCAAPPHGTLIYNALSNTLARADARATAALAELHAAPDAGRHPALYLQLRLARMLVAAGEEDAALAGIHRARRRAQRAPRALALTIAPTMHCNFACPYCFQRGRPAARMDDRVADAVAGFAGRFPDLEQLQVCWFGGEPLLEFPRLATLTGRLRRSGLAYRASMITNGYLLDTAAEQLAELGIDRLQVTIDGPEAVHNRTRPQRGGGPTRARILANLDTLMRHWSGQCVIRVNLDRNNRDAYATTWRELRARYPAESVRIVPALVRYGEHCTADQNGELSGRAAADFFLALSDSGLPGLPPLYPAPAPTGCTADCHHAFVIGPSGEVYKCMDDTGDPARVVGSVFPGRAWQRELYCSYLQGCDHFDDPRCRACFFLPVCDGGCPKTRLSGEPGSTERLCLPFRDCFPQLLAVHCNAIMAGRTPAA